MAGRKKRTKKNPGKSRGKVFGKRTGKGEGKKRTRSAGRGDSKGPRNRAGQGGGEEANKGTGLGKRVTTARELACICDRILKTKKFRDYPGARNGLQAGHGRPVRKIGWAVDADLQSIRRAGRDKVDFLVVHHGVFWGDSALDRKIRSRRIREAKRLGVAVYSSHLPLDGHPEIGNSTGLLRVLGLMKFRRRPFGKAMGREIGWKVEGGKWKRSHLVGRCEGLKSGKVKGWNSVRVIPAGPAVCRKIGIVTGGFGDLDQAKKAGLDTLITGEVDYPTEVKARELGINLILAGHFETETFGPDALVQQLRMVACGR